MIKVLLINPRSEFKTQVIPLGLAYIAAYLKKNNINVSVIDAWAEELSFDELEKRVAKTKTDIVGVYIASPRYNVAKKTIEICRKVLSNSMIVAGGPHPSAMPFETLKDIPQLDICAIGEGEITMYELVKSFQKDLTQINGIAFRKNNEIVITKPREFIKDLDTLPFPAIELFPLKKYRFFPPYGKKTPYFAMVTSRGCPFQCTFCSKDVFKDTFRARSPESVCDEIEELISKYGAKEIRFDDDDFTIDIERAETMCDEILKRGFKFYWSCSTRVDQVNENLLKKMKQAGCWLISYGVESGNQEILDSINKGFTIKQVISAFEITKRVGVSTNCFFIIGLPGDTRETIQQTLDLVKKIKPDFIACGILMVYPGSRLFKLIKAGKYTGRLRTLTENESMPAVFYSQGNFIVLEDNLTFEELKAIIQKAKRKFYLTPSYILKSLKTIRSFSNLKYYIHSGIGLIRSLIR